MSVDIDIGVFKSGIVILLVDRGGDLSLVCAIHPGCYCCSTEVVGRSDSVLCMCESVCVNMSVRFSAGICPCIYHTLSTM